METLTTLSRKRADALHRGAEPHDRRIRCRRSVGPTLARCALETLAESDLIISLHTSAAMGFFWKPADADVMQTQPIVEEPAPIPPPPPPSLDFLTSAGGQPLQVITALLVIFFFTSRRARADGKSGGSGGDGDSSGDGKGGRQKGATRWERLAYKIDNFFSTKSYASAALMLLVTVILVVFGGVLLWLAGGQNENEPASLLSSMWLAWRFVTDGGDYEEEVLPRMVGVVLVLSGMLFFALLVGLIGESIEEKLDGLKQGKNRVIESGHTLVLGWSDKLLPLISEIAKAKESEGGGVVVVMTDAHEKAWMDETVAEELPEDELFGTQIVCRTGDPVTLADLRKVSAGNARSIVILADYGLEPDMSDARAVRCVLALRYGIHTTAQTTVELRDIDNRPTIELVSQMSVSKEEGATDGGNGHKGKEAAAPPALSPLSPGAPGSVQCVVPHDIIGRLMIQCARQQHLSEVYDALCGFDGMEFYFKSWPELAGRPWGEVAFCFPDACPIGVRRPNAAAVAIAESAATGAPSQAERWGGILLNPPDDYLIGEDDEILVIAEDDDTYQPEPPHRPNPGPPPSWAPPPRPNENVLLIGWRRDLYDMLTELDKYVHPGCVVTILAPVEMVEREALLEQGKAIPLTLRHIELHHVCGSTILRRDIESVMHARAYSSVLVLASDETNSSLGSEKYDAAAQCSASDSRALTTLLLVRDVRRAMLERASSPPLSFKKGVAAGVTDADGAADGAPDGAADGALASRAPTAAAPPVPHDEFTMLGEILDSETKDLVAAAGVSDYIMSNRLMSKVMAMVSEEASVGPLFEQLFAEEGDEIYVRDVRCYCEAGETLSFWEMGARARCVGDIAIGYRRSDGELSLNPPEKTARMVWGEGDHLIVFGDDINVGDEEDV